MAATQKTIQATPSAPTRCHTGPRMSPLPPTLNDGYAYAERIGPRGAGVDVLAYLAGRYGHSTREEWRARLERGEVVLEGMESFRYTY